MAIYTASDSNYLSRASLLAANTPATVCCWVRPGVTSDWKCPIALDTGSSHYLYVETESGDWSYYYSHSGNNEGGSINLGAFSQNVWNFLAFTWQAGATHAGYSALLGASALTVNSGASSASAELPATNLVIGRDLSYTGEYFSGRIAHAKVWNAQLTQAEIEREWFSARPQRRTNLLGWYPLVGATAADCALDWSGNGNNLTVQGSPTVQDGPPVPWGGSTVFVGQSAVESPTVVDSTNCQTSSSGSITFTKPTGVQEGDLLVAVVGGGDGTYASTSGYFTEVGEGIAADVSHDLPELNIWTRVATASEPASYTWTSDQSYLQGVILVFRGADPTLGSDESWYAPGAYQNTITIPEITAEAAGSVLVGYVSDEVWSRTWTSGVMDEVRDANGAAIYTQVLSASGATGSRLFTRSASGYSNGVLFEVKAASESSEVTGTATVSAAASLVATGLRHVLGSITASAATAFEAAGMVDVIGACVPASVAALLATGWIDLDASDYLENALLDHVLMGTPLAQPASVWMSLHDGPTGDTGANELAGYSRVQPSWSASSGGEKATSAAAVFTGLPATTIVGYGLWDAEVGGNCLYSSGSIATPVTVEDGDELEFAAGDLVVRAS